MNQRIQELAEQATTTQGATRYNPLTHQVFDREKFAELIVRECIQAIQNEGQTYKHLDAGEFQANNFSQAVKQHFGVE